MVVVLDRAIWVAFVDVDDPPVVVGIGILGIKGNSLVVVLDGAVQVAFVAVGEPPIGVGLSIFWVK